MMTKICIGTICVLYIHNDLNKANELCNSTFEQIDYKRGINCEFGI